MKRWERNYIKFTVFLIIVLGIIVYMFRKHIDVLPMNKCQFFKNAFLLLIGVSVLIYFFIKLFCAVKKGFCNLRKCDDSIFNEIDMHKKCLHENNQYYIEQIRVINLYYSKNGKIDKLVKNGRIDKLYARADFLSNRIDLFDEWTTCFCSLAISVVATFVLNMMQSKSLLILIPWLLIAIASFLCIALLRYMERGQAGSYRHYIDEYERQLLMKKIKRIEKKIKMSTEDEHILHTKQIVINELIHLRSKTLFKKKIDADITKVEQLNLCIGDYSECQITEIKIKGTIGYLVYDIYKGKANNYRGGLNLINAEHTELYQILDKYNLI